MGSCAWARNVDMGRDFFRRLSGTDADARAIGRSPSGRPRIEGDGPVAIGRSGAINPENRFFSLRPGNRRSRDV